ncbi:GLPGLI family protein [Polaribacter sp. WD7]|uniref:GLPGLI family protein n=1 Tax=Polaribacter sp. WD7 TaxID=2269061 RepID=UPI000DF2F468|nr:GLPGLI family protein [Polaribacter sp. WD7]RCS28178.1 GLPGLI family protein [Polaribacter sp. WD7]
MKPCNFKFAIFSFIILITLNVHAQIFQGKAVYMSKSKMTLGSWGARLSEGQKKQIHERLKNRLEKTYVLTFNNAESMFLEEEQIDAISGATDSWGAYFSRGDQYKNIKDKKIIQAQEFYGKKFLVKDDLYKIDWKLGSETKKIGEYTCYKAKAFAPKEEIEWYNFSWRDLRKNSKKTTNTEENLKVIEAWYAPQIPVAQGPAEYWGLPGLILEVSVDNTTLLCSEITINSKKQIVIKAPDKGKETTKKEYAATVQKKMLEMRNNRMRRSR